MGDRRTIRPNTVEELFRLLKDTSYKPSIYNHTEYNGKSCKVIRFEPEINLDERTEIVTVWFYPDGRPWGTREWTYNAENFLPGGSYPLEFESIVLTSNQPETQHQGNPTIQPHIFRHVRRAGGITAKMPNDWIIRPTDKDQLLQLLLSSVPHSMVIISKARVAHEYVGMFGEYEGHHTDDRGRLQISTKWWHQNGDRFGSGKVEVYPAEWHLPSGLYEVEFRFDQIIEMPEHLKSLAFQELIPQPKESKVEIEEATQCDSITSNECVICLMSSSQWAYIPCGHLCLCSKCGQLMAAKASKPCPVCRKQASAVIRIYSA